MHPKLTKKHSIFDTIRVPLPNFGAPLPRPNTYYTPDTPPVKRAYEVELSQSALSEASAVKVKAVWRPNDERRIAQGATLVVAIVEPKTVQNQTCVGICTRFCVHISSKDVNHFSPPRRPKLTSPPPSP